VPASDRFNERRVRFGRCDSLAVDDKPGLDTTPRDADGHPRTLGSGLIQTQKAMIAASATAERKLAASLS